VAMGIDPAQRHRAMMTDCPAPGISTTRYRDKA
jgi:hypothetical protein